MEFGVYSLPIYGWCWYEFPIHYEIAIITDNGTLKCKMQLEQFRRERMSGNAGILHHFGNAHSQVGFPTISFFDFQFDRCSSHGNYFEWQTASPMFTKVI